MSFVDTRCVRPSPSLSGAVALRENPINVIGRLAIAEGYSYDLTSPHEIHVAVSGLWCEHDLTITWDAATETLSLFLMFESRMPGGRTDDICRLMSLLNERLPAGHFDYWNRDAALVYRHSMALSGGARLRTEQAMNIIAQALDAAERGYPACQYVIWAGKSPEDALTAAIIDLAGANAIPS